MVQYRRAVGILLHVDYTRAMSPSITLLTIHLRVLWRHPELIYGHGALQFEIPSSLAVIDVPS